MAERFLYIHGFNSSPESFKAKAFTQWCHTHSPRAEIITPELSHDPLVAMEQLEQVFSSESVQLMLGSSLGGYYATWLSEKYNVPAALINPAVRPWQYLADDILGSHTNYYSGRQYELTAAHVNSLARFEVPVLSTPENIFLLLQTGDEVLDYRQALEKYRDCTIELEEGGSHAFDNFEYKLPAIVAWARQLNSH